LCELFGGKVLPDWYLKMPDDFYENWPEEGYVKETTDRTDRRQWWLEKATELLVQGRPDKGMLRAAIESQRISNPELAEKLRERVRVLR
tara:strand:- start:2846 stop:3112 length:267 start_codon:yes stop_codon:yes gene_type:complete